MTKKLMYYNLMADERYTQEGVSDFKINDSKAKGSDPNDGGITEVEFKSLIKQDIKKLIGSYHENVVVLLGAGASVVTDENGIVNEYGKTVDMIANTVIEKLNADNDLFSIDEMKTKVNYTIEHFNLEDFLSMVLSFVQFLKSDDSEHDKFIKTKDKIFEIIKGETMYDYNASLMKHGALLKILSAYTNSANKLNVMTTNYDTLIEDAAESLKFTVIDGFTFSSNPVFDASMFDWHLVKDVGEMSTKEVAYKSNVINLLKVHGSLTWEKDSLEPYNLRKLDKHKVSNPVMIFPSSNKYMQSYSEPYFEIFSKFQELIKKPKTLLITVGFSFQDTHISKMITETAKSNTSLYLLVTDYNIEQAHTNWNNLINMRGFPILLLSATLNGELNYYIGGNHGDR